MANPQHIQWLKEGIVAWNKRRKSETFAPDLSYHDFGGRTLFETNRARERDQWERVPLRGIHLTDANLAHADLRVVDLSEAVLYRANLTGASLSQAILVGTDLRFANLTAANFVHADLTGAKFGGYGATLTDANLQAVVTEADFREADLTEAKWLPGELWKAHLFWPQRSPRQDPRELAPIETVSDLLKTINDTRQFHNTLTEAHGKTTSRLSRYEEVLFYFRGEPKCGWELRPSVMRDHLRVHESAMLRDVTSRRPGEFSGISSALGRWVTAQHHGLRTRFLDVTRNPLVALFHACADSIDEDGRLHLFAAPKSLIKPYDSDIISIIANLARLSHSEQVQLLNGSRRRDSVTTRRLYQLIRSDKPYFDERIDPRDLYRVFVVEPQRSTDRIRAQSGAFLVSAFHERFERDEILKWNKDTPVYAHCTLTVPSGSKAGLSDELQFLNVSRETLFPGLDASAFAVSEHYLQKVPDRQN